MEHIYTQPQFGEDWFNYSSFYKGIVETFDTGSTFVEVGSWKGKSSSFMIVEIINSGKDIDLYCVDTWEGSLEHQGNGDLVNLYNTFLTNMSPLEEYYFPLKISSLSAASKFKDKSIDFVYIDASHEYLDVIKDIKSWMPKVKPGGIIAGHDYANFYGVTQAVDELISNPIIYYDQTVWSYKIPETV
jgi:hypothetical protein